MGEKLTDWMSGVDSVGKRLIKLQAYGVWWRPILGSCNAVDKTTLRIYNDFKGKRGHKDDAMHRHAADRSNPEW